MADEVESATLKYGVVHHPKYGDIYAYECDGFGNVLLMDDAGLPSLISIPYLGYKTASDPVYVNTRRFVLSADNPYFQKGLIEGTGSPHTPGPRIWPMGIISRAMTSSDPVEINDCLRWLKLSNVGTGFMHESCNKDVPAKFTRRWFAWVNNLFGELILKLAADQPACLQFSSAPAQ
jgi:meiotically up-regulated gene 157 (Mug157) protein